MSKKKYGWREFKGLINEFMEDKLIFSIGILSRIVSTFLSLYLTYRIKDLIDDFGQTVTRNNLLMELFIFFIFQIVLVVISTYIMEVVGIQVVTNLRKKIFNKILYLPKKSLDNNINGKISLKIVDDTTLIYEVISKYLAQSIGAIISVIISLVVLFSIDFRLTIITLGILLLCILLIYPLSKRKSLLHKQMDKEAEKLNKFSEKVIENNELIKAFGTEESTVRQGNRLINSSVRKTLKQVQIMAILSPIMRIMIFGITFLVLALGGIRVSTDLISIGELLVFIMYMIQILIPTSMILTGLASKEDVGEAIGRLSNILEEDNESSGEEILSDDKFSLEFRNIDFRYDISENNILSEFNLKVQDREKISITGPKKSGKSTIFKLIERIYEVDNGEIFVNDIDIKDISIDNLREKIGYISKDLPLISGSIRENILYGTNKYMPDSIIIKYCDFVGLYGFIQSLENGLDTYIGKKGVNLTDEEKIKISFVRSLIRRPSILLIDNISYNLNDNGIENLKSVIDNLYGEMTIMIITNNIDTIKKSDKVIYMEKGKIKGIGNHEKLIVNHENYANYMADKLN